MSLPEAARMMAVWGGSAGVVGLISLALPHADTRNELALLIINLSLIVLGIAVFAAPERWPGWIVRLFPTWAVVISSSGVIFTGNPITPIAIFYLWAPIHSLMFASRREFVWTLGLTIVAATTVFATVGTPEMASTAERVRALLCGGATLAFICSMVIYQRVRIERAYRGLESASRTDVLTELPNARGFFGALAVALGGAEQSGRPLSVIALDVDRLRTVNERLGHNRGDEVLRDVASRLRGSVRASDVVGRTGQSEFGILLRDSGEHEAYLAAEQLLGRVRETLADELTPITASVGIAAFPAHGRTPEELLKLARRALAVAKRTGRDCAVIFNAETSDAIAPVEKGRGERNASLGTLVSVVEAAEARGALVSGHGARVGAVAEAMALELGLSGYRAERLRLAGILQSLGVVGIPDSILRKAGPLSDEEREQVRMQPEIAARMLGAREVADIRGWILSARERPDGAGYPRGLHDAEIPLEAKILAVAEAYVSMQEPRRYRDALGKDTARAEIRERSGTQFASEAVDALMLALKRGSSTLSPV